MASSDRNTSARSARLSRGGRPAAAMEGTDAESGDAGAGSGQSQALYALKALRDRGLIDAAAFEERKAEIEAGKVNPEDF